VFEMKKDLFILPGYLIGIGCLGLITYRTLSAVRTESKTITVQVNQYGEQYLDVALLVVFWIVCIIGVLSIMTRTNETKMKRRSMGHDHQKTDRENQGLPLGFSRYPLKDETTEIPPGILRTPTTELTERFSELDEEQERTTLANEKKDRYDEPP